MKLFRLRFILLGLLLCLYHVWCLNCEKEFVDPASSAYLADIVILVKLSQKLPPLDRHYNATVLIKNKRSILKGSSLLKPLLSRRGPSLVTVGEFGLEEPRACIANLDKGAEYILFLQRTVEHDFFRTSAMPISNRDRKNFKRGKKDIKKILCKKPPCYKIPEFHGKRKMKDEEIGVGETLELNCRLKSRSMPPNVFVWLKNGTDIATANPNAAIKNSKKNSRLRIRKTSISDSGTYTCIAKNVGGEVRQEATIRVAEESRPEVGDLPMVNIEQRFGGTLKLNCRIKEQTAPKTRFTWFKDGKEINTAYKDGSFSIKTKGTESRLRKDNTLLSDQGVYKCVASNPQGELIQQSNVTVTGAPQKKVKCTKEEASFCLNNATCEKYVELDRIFCTCKYPYGGDRCMKLMWDKTREGKLAKDRTFVVVGIISGILLFIGICVVSYFLAKRRRDRFLRRRRQRTNGNMEDNIPQVYRPLIGCDDIDGLTKKQNADVIEKSVQTVETCFLNQDNPNLYINPNENYRGDRNSRSRKDAMSLENEPRPDGHGANIEDENIRNKNNKNSNQNFRVNMPGHPSSIGNSDNDLNIDGAPNEHLNDLSPKRKPVQRETVQPVVAKPTLANIPSPDSSLAPAFNIETDSDEEIPTDVAQLTPLHISEDEENADDYSSIFKKCKSKIADSFNLNSPENITSAKSKESLATDKQSNEQSDRPKQPPHPEKERQRPIADRSDRERDRERERERRKLHPHGERGDRPREPRPPPSDRSRPPVERDRPPVERDRPPVERDRPPVERDRLPVERDRPPVERDRPQMERDRPPVDRERAPGERDRDRERERRRLPLTQPDKHRLQGPSRGDRESVNNERFKSIHPQTKPALERVDRTEPVNKQENKPDISSLTMVTHPQSDKSNANPTASGANDELNDSSSSSTEGCDSPTTAWHNAQYEFSDQAPSPDPNRTWNGPHDGPAKPQNKGPENYFKMFPKMEPRTSSSPNIKSQKNLPPEVGRTKLKDKFSIAI